LTEVLTDHGPYIRDDYLSMIIIAVATSMKIFPKLLKIRKTYEKIVGVLHGEISAELLKHFDEMMTSLENLDKKWKEKGDWALENVVCVPTDLEIGAGY